MVPKVLLLFLLALVGSARADDELNSQVTQSLAELAQINGELVEAQCGELGPDRTSNAHKVETDTLYSWQPLSQVVTMASVDPQNPLAANGYLYAWRTPAATFGYGDVQVRIKLKPQTKFFQLEAMSRDCRMLPREVSRDYVYVIPLAPPHLVDYLICSPEVISSWSFGSAKGNEEAKTELENAKKYPAATDIYGEMSACPDCVFGAVGDQAKGMWRAKELERKLRSLEVLSHEGFGRVFCLDSERDCKETHFASHFATTFRRPSARAEDISGEAVKIRSPKESTALYLFEDAVLGDPDIGAAAELLRTRGDLRPIVVSSKGKQALLENVPSVQTHAVKELLDVAELIGPAEFRRRSEGGNPWVIRAEEAPTSSGAINLGREAAAADPLRTNVSRLVGGIYRAEEVLAGEKAFPGLRNEFLKLVSGVPLAQGQDAHRSGIYYERRAGKCLRRSRSSEEEAEVSSVLCALRE